MRVDRVEGKWKMETTVSLLRSSASMQSCGQSMRGFRVQGQVAEHFREDEWGDGQQP